MQSGRLFLIPVTLGDTNPPDTLPLKLIETVRALDEFIVEDEKSARRILKKINPEIKFDAVTMHLLNEHTKSEEITHYLASIGNGKDIGLLSEAGCPCVADPGALIVQRAHKNSIKVVPLTGPSSIILALMASGFNGQSFTFHGYIPVEKDKRNKKISELEKTARSTGYTQIFIETPYRNNQILADIIAHCSADTQLCIAVNLTTDEERIMRCSVSEWKKKSVDFNKQPAVFLIGKNV
jgi:16S rRNA (cytidine1402-2'-O)-methyltransferase